MSAGAIRELAERLGASSRALAALGAAAQARATGTPLDPAIQARINEVLDALGARQLISQASPAELQPVLGGIRSELFLGARLVSGDAPVAGWSPMDPAVLQAAGDVSVGFPGVLERAIAPRLDALPERLGAPDASFLDVGVGVAAMAVEMARRWPSLRVVGLEPWPAAIAAARHNLREAGLADRIELREQRAEDLPDEGRFDLAWVPSVFISGQVLPSILERVRRALRPGGWLLLAFADLGTDDPLVAALTRLRTTLWGGTQATRSEIEALLARSGLVGITTLPGPPGSPVAMVAGRRPEAASAARREPESGSRAGRRGC
jgi:precorrin-6B methylase 2